MIWRIFEIADNGTRTVAGWGDHASIEDAKRTVALWGRIVAWEIDMEHDAADALIVTPHGLGAVQLAVEPIFDVPIYPVN